MTWHPATPQRLAPVGPGRTMTTVTVTAPAHHGRGLVVPRRRRPGPASSECHGGLVLRYRRSPRSQLAGLSDSDCDVTFKSTALIRVRRLTHPAAHVSCQSPAGVLMEFESGDIGCGGTGRGSVLNGRCARPGAGECGDVMGIVCRCSHYYTAPVRTLHKGRPSRGGENSGGPFAS